MLSNISIGRHTVIVAQDADESVQEDGLTVAAEPVEEEERVLASNAGERAAGHTLQEALQRAVAVGDLIKEPQEQRAALRPERRQLSSSCSLRAAPACVSPVRRLTTPPGVLSSHGSAIPQLDGRGCTLIGLCKAVNSGSRRACRKFAAFVRRVGTVAGHFPAVSTYHIEYTKCDIFDPAGAVPAIPGALARHIAQVGTR